MKKLKYSSYHSDKEEISSNELEIRYSEVLSKFSFCVNCWQASYYRQAMVIRLDKIY